MAESQKPKTEPALKHLGNRLELVGIIVSIIIGLISPKQLVTVIGVGVLFVCSALLLWHSRWVENYLSRRVLGTIVIFGACLGFGYLVWPASDRPTPELTGLLIPSNKQSPQDACGRPIAPHKVLTISLGPLLLVTAKAYTSIRVQGEKVFSVEKEGDGIKISARVLSRDQVIAAVADNVLYVNPNNRFELQRPDWHSLIVFDKQDKRKVLDVYFLNPKSVRVFGDFYISHNTAFSVGEKSSFVGTNLMEGFEIFCLWVDNVIPSSNGDFGGVTFLAE